MKSNCFHRGHGLPGKKFLLFFCLFLLGSVPVYAPGMWVNSSWAGTCVDSGCHASIASARYVHGPVAVESSGQKGCTICHAPAGEPCTASKGGKFTFQHSQEILCSSCHIKGTGSQHTGAEGKCISCHNPHSSEVSDRFLK